MTEGISDAVPGLSNAEYHDGMPWREYLSSSQLKLYRISPKYARHMMDHPAEETEAQRFGTHFHDLMASLALTDGDQRGFCEWEKKFVIPEPLVNPRTGKPYGADTQKYQDYLAALKADNPGRELLSRENYDSICAMADSLLRGCGATSEQVGKLLRWGAPEVSVFLTTEDGVRLKVRPDLLTPNMIIDWKTFAGEDLTEDSINRAILRYGYHISAAMYQWVCEKIYRRWFPFILVFIQKRPPYDCVMVDMGAYGYRYDAEWDILQRGPGAVEFENLLKLHSECLATNDWPGAETFIEGDRYRIMEIQPPRYYSYRFMEDY